jgi:putative nucleotidyltransferase with HDIG domain
MLFHLAKRFFGSLSRREPDVEAQEWVLTQLNVGERELWSRMSAADRRHAIGVAERVLEMLREEATRPVVAAALLHDVGKVDAQIGPVGRALATVIDRRTGPSRFARYRRHDQIGAAMLDRAESDPLTIAWTREHHLAEVNWSLPPEVARALKAADDD